MSCRAAPGPQGAVVNASAPTPRADLRSHLEELEILTRALARQEREGTLSAQEVEVKLMILEGAVCEARSLATYAAGEEESA